MPYTAGIIVASSLVNYKSMCVGNSHIGDGGVAAGAYHSIALGLWGIPEIK